MEPLSQFLIALAHQSSSCDRNLDGYGLDDCDLVRPMSDKFYSFASVATKTQVFPGDIDPTTPASNRPLGSTKRDAKARASSCRRGDPTSRPHPPPAHELAPRPPLLAAVGLLVLCAALVLVAPGALFVFAAEHVVSLRLDLGQRWTWAIAVSSVAACVMSLLSRRVAEGFARYMLLALIASALVLVARFGMHTRWAAEMLRAYVP